MAVQKHIIVILQSRTCGYYKKYDWKEKEKEKKKPW